MGAKIVSMKTDLQKIINDLLNQNAQLRLEVAWLRAAVEEQKDIERQMEQSRNIPPEALEMLSKLDIR